MAKKLGLAVAFCVACGGNSGAPPDAGSAVSDAATPDAPPDAPAPLPRMFGIVPTGVAGEAFGTTVDLVTSSGATYIPQPIDWSGLEAGPDDAFAFASIDTKKWDVTGSGFAADAGSAVLRYTSPSARDGDGLRARYTLDGALAATVDAAIVAAAGSHALLLVRFDAGTGSTCAAPTDNYLAVAVAAGSGGTGVFAVSCRAGAFTNEGLAAAGAAATLRIRRDATQLVVETGAATPVAALPLASVPAAFGGPGRVELLAGNAQGASAASFANLHVDGTATWDVPSDRFVGDPGFEIPAILDGFYGARSLPLVITLNTINTVRTQLPSDLQGLVDPSTGLVDLSRPEIRARYRAAIDYLLAALPHVRVVGMSVGNEIDGYLGTNATAWAEASAFATDAITYAQSKLPPGALASITVTAAGLRAHPDLVAQAEAAASAVFVTYYPLEATFAPKDPSVVASDVEAILAATPKPVLFAEAGYPTAPASPSCPLCAGSEQRQADFFTQLFAAWDAHRARMYGFAIDWLSDVSDAQVAVWRTYYGDGDPAFLAYLATIGLRTQTGTPKQALATVQAAAHARGL